MSLAEDGLDGVEFEDRGDGLVRLCIDDWVVREFSLRDARELLAMLNRAIVKAEAAS